VRRCTRSGIIRGREGCHETANRFCGSRRLCGCCHLCALFDADPKGVVSQYGKDVPLANGIILSPDEKTLYVSNGAVVFAFGVKPASSFTVDGNAECAKSHHRHSNDRARLYRATEVARK
jgi:sugar lactone lactonase YvrE